MAPSARADSAGRAPACTRTLLKSSPNRVSISRRISGASDSPGALRTLRTPAGAVRAPSGPALRVASPQRGQPPPQAQGLALVERVGTPGARVRTGARAAGLARGRTLADRK